MKIKRTYSFFILLCLSLLNVFAKNNFQPKTEAIHFFNDVTYRPSNLSLISIKSYFDDLSYSHNYYDQETISVANKSKTAKFNKQITKYVKDIYNSKYYANYLSQNGTHIVEFLELSNEVNLDTQSLYTGLRLFYNKIKSCELIDDTVIIQILAAMPTLLEKYFDEDDFKTPTTSHLSKTIEDQILFKFTENLNGWNEEPNQFITELSQKIAQITKQEIEDLKKEYDDKELLQRLRQTIIRFFELALNKTIWNHLEYEGIWESFRMIGNGLQLLGVHYILDHMDDLDDLLWSLVYRFCFFLDLTGSTLPISFYEEIESDLANGLIDFLEAPEQDEGIKTKKEILSEKLLRAKTKAFAYEQQGLFTDQMI